MPKKLSPKETAVNEQLVEILRNSRSPTARAAARLCRSMIFYWGTHDRLDNLLGVKIFLEDMQNIKKTQRKA